jgi:hypothetical protein
MGALFKKLLFHDNHPESVSHEIQSICTDISLVWFQAVIKTLLNKKSYRPHLYRG